MKKYHIFTSPLVVFEVDLPKNSVTVNIGSEKVNTQLDKFEEDLHQFLVYIEQLRKWSSK